MRRLIKDLEWRYKYFASHVCSVYFSGTQVHVSKLTKNVQHRCIAPEIYNFFSNNRLDSPLSQHQFLISSLAWFTLSLLILLYLPLSTKLTLLVTISYDFTHVASITFILNAVCAHLYNAWRCSNVITLQFHTIHMAERQESILMWISTADEQVLTKDMPWLDSLVRQFFQSSQ